MNFAAILEEIPRRPRQRPRGSPRLQPQISASALMCLEVRDIGNQSLEELV